MTDKEFGKLEIKVYCDGCEAEKACLCQQVAECAEELQLGTSVVRVTEVVERVAAGIPLSPALSVNGQLLAIGTALSKETVLALIRDMVNNVRSRRGFSAQL